MSAGAEAGTGAPEEDRPPPGRNRPSRIVSGGQTGVDRAALDVALRLGIDCGGWCPAGRLAEDGRIPDRYPLQETGSPEPEGRTRANVRDSDGTLVLTRGAAGGGTLLAIEEARRIGKPLMIVSVEEPDIERVVRRWLDTERVERLNVAGPRESEEPGIHALASSLLRAVLEDACEP